MSGRFSVWAGPSNGSVNGGPMATSAMCLGIEKAGKQRGEKGSEVRRQLSLSALPVLPDCLGFQAPDLLATFLPLGVRIQ